jgi:hypothetical protein
VAILHNPDRTDHPHPSEEIYSHCEGLLSHLSTTDPGNVSLPHGIPRPCDSPRTPVAPNVPSPDLFGTAR